MAKKKTSNKKIRVGKLIPDKKSVRELDADEAKRIKGGKVESGAESIRRVKPQ